MPSFRWRIAVLAMAVLAAAVVAQKEPTPVVREADGVAAARRVAAAHITRALAVPAVDDAHPTPYAFTADDGIAIDHFRAAASTAEGFDLVCATASTSSMFVARRALAAMLEVAPVGHPARTVPPLLVLVDHADPVVVSMALPVLAKCTTGPMPAAIKQQLIERAIVIWPKDLLTLHWVDPRTAPAYRQCWSPQAHFAREQRLIAIAIGTGDRGLVDRLFPAGASAPNPKDERYGAFAWFVRNCLARAAPHVDDDTSRLLCRWFLVPASEAMPGDAARAWMDLALEVLFGVFRHAPADLHANYRELLQNDHVNQFFRTRVERDPVDLVRLRLLLLPVDRECDRHLALLFPDYVAAALAGTAAERRRIVELLAWQVSVPSTVTSVGRERITVEIWRAQIDALAKLPATERVQVLEAIAARDSLLAIGIDVVPLLRAAQKERDAAAKPRQ